MIDADKLRWLTRSPYSAAVYLHAHGWQMVGATSTESLWTLDSNGQLWEALLPLDAGRSDALRRVDELLTVLGVVERRTAEDLIRDLGTAQSDVIRVRATPDTPSGTAPIEEAVQVVSASRELLLSIAASVDTPRPVLASRKPDRAIEFVRSVRLSTEPGSFVVALEAPVESDMAGANVAAAAGELQDALFADPRTPFARQVTELLVRSIGQSLRAAAEVAAGADLTVFDSSVDDGVSANLLESLVRLGGGRLRGDARARDEGAVREIGLDVRWSFGREAPAEAQVRKGRPLLRRSYIITRDVIPVFSEAAASIRARQPEPEVTLFGPVVGLRRDDSLGTDTVTISAAVRTGGDAARVRNVRLVLDSEEQHQLVSRAYQTREPVIASGDLQPAGFLLSMQPVRSLTLFSGDQGTADPPTAATSQS